MEKESRSSHKRHYDHRRSKSRSRSPDRRRRHSKDRNRDRPVHIKEEPRSPPPRRLPPENRNRTRDHRDRPKHREDKRQYEWGKRDNQNGGDRRKPDEPPKDKQKPNFETSGKLLEDTNVYNGVVIKYNEPEEARIPRRKWRLYPFKGDEPLPFICLHRQSAYLLGKDRKVADMPIDHPSCSKQHAVFQYRLVPYERPDGSTGRRVRPYIIDLESTNGTFVNNKKIEPKRYVELFERDLLKFGYSSREYVLLTDESKDDAIDDDVEVKSEKD